MSEGAGRGLQLTEPFHGVGAMPEVLRHEEQTKLASLQLDLELAVVQFIDAAFAGKVMDGRRATQSDETAMATDEGFDGPAETVGLLAALEMADVASFGLRVCFHFGHDFSRHVEACEFERRTVMALAGYWRGKEVTAARRSDQAGWFSSGLKGKAGRT